MRRIRRIIALTSIAAVMGIALTSCDSAERLAAPQDEIAPQYSPSQSNARYSRVVATVNVGAVETVEVNANGGVILIKHGNDKVAALVVQAGTVRNNTMFTLDLTASSSEVIANLAATSEGSKVPNDVGMKGFKKPVYLLFNAEFLSVTEADRARLGIAELQDNGKIVPTRSVVASNFWLGAGQFEGTWVVGLLPHFSGWVPVLN